MTVFLEECKDDFKKSQSDAEKLKKIIKSKDKMDGLAKLVKKTTGLSKIDDTKISVVQKRQLPFLHSMLIIFSCLT